MSKPYITTVRVSNREHKFVKKDRQEQAPPPTTDAQRCQKGLPRLARSPTDERLDPGYRGVAHPAQRPPGATASGAARARGLQQFGSEACDGAALAGAEGDVTEARLATERLDEHRQRVVGLAEVRRVDLAGVAGEDDLRALADAREHRLQRGGLEVLGLVDHHDLAVQAATTQERDRLE